MYDVLSAFDCYDGVATCSSTKSIATGAGVLLSKPSHVFVIPLHV